MLYPEYVKFINYGYTNYLKHKSDGNYVSIIAFDSDGNVAIDLYGGFLKFFDTYGHLKNLCNDTKHYNVHRKFIILTKNECLLEIAKMLF